MKNSFRILGETTEIVLNNTDRAAVIDTASLDLVMRHPGTWYLNNGRVVANNPRSWSRSMSLLSRWIASPKDDEWVSFKDGDSLNHQRTNLLTFAKNQNEYRILDDHAVLLLRNKRHEVVAETKVDLADLDRVLGVGAWFLVNSGYAGIRRDSMNIDLHRFIMNAPPQFVVDHISGDPLDNRRRNLRVVTQAANMQNRRGASANSSSGILGVHRHFKSKKWVVNVGGQYFGLYSDISDAETVARNRRAMLMPFSPEAREIAMHDLCQSCAGSTVFDLHIRRINYSGGLVLCKKCDRVVLFEKNKSGKWIELLADEKYTFGGIETC